MIRLFTNQLPEWARPGHPVLRYELGKESAVSRRSRLIRFGLIVLLGALVIAGGYYIATQGLTQPPGQHPTESMMNVLYYPTLVFQVVASIAAISLTAGMVAEEKRRQTWDNLRATRGGAQLALRARWAAVFYRLRWLLVLLVGVRLLLIGGMLFDLTAFRGGYLDRLLNGITPDVGLVIGVMLLSFWMTASLLLPFTGVGLDAALGLLVSTIVQGRAYGVLTQVLLALIRVAIIAGLVVLMNQMLDGRLVVNSTIGQQGLLAMPESSAWFLTATYGGLADWGLRFLEVGFGGQLWATIPYGVFLGLALLVFAFMQAALTDVVLALAVRRAETVG
jgi:hypothetical protein